MRKTVTHDRADYLYLPKSLPLSLTHTHTHTITHTHTLRWTQFTCNCRLHRDRKVC